MSPRPDVLMLLSHALAPDPRVSKEAETLVATGYRVHVLAWDRTGKHPPAEEGAFSIERMSAPSSSGSGFRQLRGFLRFWLWLVRRGRAIRPRAVHAHDLDTFPAGYVLAKLLRVPLVFDNHELYAQMQVGRMPKLAIRLIAAFERFAVRRATVSVVVSHIAYRYFEAVRPDAVIVGNWYSPVHDDPEAARAVRAELGVPDHAFLIGYTGGLPRARNFEPLFGAADADPNVYVFIAGKGDQADDIRRRAASNERIKFIGFTNEPERYFNAFDALYYLYREDEHYGKFSASNALGRAMSYGKPLLTNDWGENGLVMRQVDPALLLNAATADEVLRVVRMLCDGGTMAGVRARIKELARAEYSWEPAGAAVAGIYRRILPKEVSPV